MHDGRCGVISCAVSSRTSCHVARGRSQAPAIQKRRGTWQSLLHKAVPWPTGATTGGRCLSSLRDRCTVFVREAVPQRPNAPNRSRKRRGGILVTVHVADRPDQQPEQRSRLQLTQPKPAKAAGADVGCCRASVRLGVANFSFYLSFSARSPGADVPFRFQLLLVVGGSPSAWTGARGQGRHSLPS